jgi:DNA-binding response OmpR family regulator
MTKALPTPNDLGIAVVEDNDTLRDMLVSYLEQPGRRVYGVDCGEALNTLLSTQPLDIAVLDLGLPHEDGLSIAQRLRRSHPHLKIVMLTARARPTDRTQGYDAGADVYLTKPTNITELDAVVRNLSQRRGAATSSGFVLNRASQILSSPQRRHANLSAVESKLLEMLALAPVEGLHAETLLEALRTHGNTALGRDNLAVIISRLRHKILVELETPDLIHTVRNFGYRLSLPLVLD